MFEILLATYFAVDKTSKNNDVESNNKMNLPLGMMKWMGRLVSG